MTINSSWFGHRLRELRSAAGLSRDVLAQKAGLTVSGIIGIESGRARYPNWDTVCRLCDALAVEANAFQREPVSTAKLPRGRPPTKRIEEKADERTVPSPDATEDPERQPGEASVEP